MYIFGRADNTLSYMGANIYPEDIEEALFDDIDDACRLGAFAMELIDIGNSEVRPCVHVELLSGDETDQDLIARLRHRILNRLISSNKDFQSAMSEDATVAEITVRLHAPATGPFVTNKLKIKRRYIVKTEKAPALAT
jgi:phenylacetate-CoA ligase